MTLKLSVVTDKSALQMLGAAEIRWLHHFFSTVITPVLMIETLGNLKKEWEDGRSPVDFLANMASKIRSFQSYPNVSSRTLIVGEFAGNAVEMRGRPVVGGGQEIADHRGRKGIFFDVFPEDADLMRWSDKEFSEAEEQLAALWREGLNELEASQGQATRRDRHRRGVKSIADVHSLTSAFLGPKGEQWRILQMAMDMFEAPTEFRPTIKARWIALGRPPIAKFLPYTVFVMHCNISYTLADDAGLLPSRATNVIDVQYLHYLPFCHVFVSGDKVHHHLAPGLMRPNQCYIKASEMKRALGELATYYDRHEAEIEKVGMLKAAPFLPLEIHTEIHSAFDCVHPTWRTLAKEPPPSPLTSEQRKRIWDELKPMRDAIEKAHRA